jgi:hypothetical protein
MKVVATLFLVGLLAGVGEAGSGPLADGERSEPVALDGGECPPVEIVESERPVAELPKEIGLPPARAGLGARLDFGHDWVYLEWQRLADRVDGWFVPAGAAKVPLPESPFRLDVDSALWEDEDSRTTDVTARFDVDLRLPNAERWLRGFVTTTGLDELTGFGDKGGGLALRAGLGGSFLDAIDADIGVSIDLSPEVFASVKYAPRWRFGMWQVRPFLKGYWSSDEGLGSAASVAIDRRIGHAVIRSASAAKLTDETEGVEWRETLLVAWAPETIAERRAGALADGLDIARGWGIRATVNGKTDGPKGAETVEVGVFARFPLRKRWLFGFVEPAIRWRAKTDRERELGIRVGLVSLFWGLESD